MGKLKYSRDDFSAAVIRALRDRAGSLCSQPACRKPTVGADLSTERGVTIIGEAAHICAAASNGPRYDPRQSNLQRMSLSNGIWLCAACATLIDKNNGRNFSAALLRRWKLAAERSAAYALLFAGSMQRPPWLDRLSLHYVNVPRLQMSAPDAFTGLNIGPNGFGDGFIADLVLAAERAIVAAEMRAIPLDDLLPASEEIVGSVFAFNEQCYTKNGRRNREASVLQRVHVFHPDRSPHFYLKTQGVRVIFPYDPRWIAGSTAHSEFNAGRRRFAGLGLVKSVADDLSEIVASPLAVGVAPHPSMDLFLRSSRPQA